MQTYNGNEQFRTAAFPGPPDLVEREAEIPQQRDAQQRLQILLAVVAVFILPPRGSEQPLLLVVADVRAREAAALFDLFDVHKALLPRSAPILPNAMIPHCKA